jgi:hypothetical protein
MIELLEGNYGGAVAFAPHLAQVESRAATTPHADVFARRERQATMLPLGIISRTERIRFEDLADILITYPDTGAGLPSWVVPVLRSLSERRGVKPGWDSYDAKPTDSRHIDRLMSYLFAVMVNSSTPPLITPLWDGGVQATWHRNSKDLEVVMSADEPPTYYFHDVATGEEEEEKLDESRLARVRTLIRQF